MKESLSTLQAGEFRRHHERVWPLDYWIDHLLPVAQTLWLSFVIAALMGNSTATTATTAGIDRVFLATRQYLWTYVALNSAIILLALMVWLLSTRLADLLPPPIAKRIQWAKKQLGRAPKVAFTLGVLIAATAAFALSVRQLRNSGWIWWIAAVAPVATWTWWQFRAFRRVFGPSLKSIITWRFVGILICTLAVVVWAVGSKQERDVQTEAKNNVKAAEQNLGLVNHILAAVKIPTNIPGPPLTEQQRRTSQETARLADKKSVELPKDKLPTGAPNSRPAGTTPLPSASTQPGAVRSEKLSLSDLSPEQIDLLFRLLRLLGGDLSALLALNGGNDNPGESQDAVISSVIAKIKAAPAEDQSFAQVALVEIAKSNNNSPFVPRINRVIEGLRLSSAGGSWTQPPGDATSDKAPKPDN